jgi:hypothetical protein
MSSHRATAINESCQRRRRQVVEYCSGNFLPYCFLPELRILIAAGANLIRIVRARPLDEKDVDDSLGVRRQQHTKAASTMDSFVPAPGLIIINVTYSQ